MPLLSVWGPEPLDVPAAVDRWGASVEVEPHAMTTSAHDQGAICLIFGQRARRGRREQVAGVAGSPGPAEQRYRSRRVDPLSQQRSVRKSTLPAVPISLQGADDEVRSASGNFEPGAQVGHSKVFDIVERIGEGGMGRVYRAFDPVMDRYVAMKVLKSDVPANERERFRREAVIAANFSHPNLPRVLDRGTIEKHGLEWMTLEYLRGRDLGEIIDRNRRVSVPLMVDIFAQTLDALDYMHTRGIVHCDVKPDNIFVTRDPYDRRLVIVKLIDFGICRRIDEPPPPRLMGDPRYMAPEQTVLRGPVDGRTDLYPLGLSIFETLVGLHPFSGIDDADTRTMLRMQNEQAVPKITDVLPELPDDVADALDGVLEVACAKIPGQRFASARAMKTALLQVVPTGQSDASG